MTELPVGLEDIRQAAMRLKGKIRETPLIEDDLINSMLGGRLLFKCEALQRTGSFKFRGAMNAVAQLEADHIVAFSSGNHAQGVALAAKLCGKAATIVMPQDAPAIKQDNTRALGAELRLYDRWAEDRDEIAKELVAASGAALVRPYDDLDVIAGQGTVGLEMVQSCQDLGIEPDQAIVCCGGGGLTSGVAIALRAYFDAIDIFTSEPQGFDDMARSLKAGTHIANEPGAQTICDAIVTPRPGNITFPIIKRLVKAGLVVSDLDVQEAMKLAFERLKVVLEPGGAVAMAAAITNKLPVSNKTTLVVLSGGNVDQALYRSLLSPAH